MSARVVDEGAEDTAKPDTDRRELRAGAWRWAGGAVALGVLSILAIFWETAWSIAHTWSTSPAFSHGFLIAPISGFLIWRQRDRLARLSPKPSILGLAASAVAALVWLIGDVAAVQILQQVALIAFLQCVVLAVIGIRATAVIAVPLLYLFFGAPFGTFLIAPLQDVTAAFVVRMLQLIGMPVYLDGIFIHIPSGSFEVAEACAGLRFLITSIALGVIFAYEFYRQLWRRALFMALSVIVPIIANGFRATGIVLLAHYSDYEIAAGADHITYGLIFLSLVLFCLLGIGYSFREPYSEIAAAAAPSATPAAQPADNQAAARVLSLLRFPAAAAGVLLIAVASWTYATQVVGTDEKSRASLSSPAAGPWHAVAPVPTDWQPTFPNASQEIMQSYSDGARRVDVYLAFFAQQRQGAEAVNWMNSLAGAAPWTRGGGGSLEVQVSGQSIAANYERIVARERRRTIWYWYWVDGRLTDSPLYAKVLEAKAKLLRGEQAAAVIALATDSTDDPKVAQAALSEFLAQAWPLTQMVATQKF